MKTILAFSILALTLLTSSTANAEWSPVSSPEQGFHEIIVEDSVEFFRQFSFLNDFRNGKEYVCSNATKGSCSTLNAANFNVILPVCLKASDLDCIVGINAKSDSKESAGLFSRYTMPEHPSLFKGDGKRFPLNPQSPSVWTLEDAPHESGTEYVVHAGFAGGINNGKVTSSDFYAQIYAIEEVPGRGEQFDENNYSNFNWCNFNPRTRALIGCGGGGSIENEICVVQFQLGGTCGAKRTIPSDLTLTLSLRLSSEPNGWYHGRVDNPSLSLVKIKSGVNLEISGTPISVPILYHSVLYKDASPAVKRYWDQCAKSFDCPKSTRDFGADLETQSGEIRNITSEQKAWTPKALATVKFFNKVNNGTSPKVDQVWAIRSLENTNSRGGRCYSSKGFKGMVTTNATAYSDGPPTLAKGVLEYSVAAPTKLLQTGDEILGNYNLVMRSTFAKCIYGGKNVSPRAEISVTALAGEYRVATSITRRNSQWIRLSANNFNY